MGLQSNHDSREQLQAATLAEYYCATRRARADGEFRRQPESPAEFSHPSAQHDRQQSRDADLCRDGTTTTLAKGDARFGVLYNITAPAKYAPSTSPGVATMYLCIFWPPQGSTTSAGTGHFELSTSVTLP